MNRFFITGTDTGVGKTVVAAILTKILAGNYWKPIQTGITDDVLDRVTVKTLTDLPDHHFHASTYELKPRLSPNHAAELENVNIDIYQCHIPLTDRALIIEGAGGVFVPLNQQHSMLDLMAHINFPVIIVSRGTLGTLNHTLLTIHALRQRNIKIHGVIFSGELNPANQKTIEQWGNIRTLLHVPHFERIEKSKLYAWMEQQKENILREFA